MAGAIAGIIGGSITFPLDTIKTKLQNNAAGEYSGIMDVIRKTYARSGIAGFYKGLPAVMVGITPEKAIKLGSTSFRLSHITAHHISALILEISLPVSCSSGNTAFQLSSDILTLFVSFCRHSSIATPPHLCSSERLRC